VRQPANAVPAITMSSRSSEIPIRPGYPTSCVVCGKPLHRKSEHYCSLDCESANRRVAGPDAPSFRSKWKGRKRKLLEDPFARTRVKTRAKTKSLINAGALKPTPCEVCGSRDVVPHHEDYENPRAIIWLCERDHKRYHAGEVALNEGTLWWDALRLIPRGARTCPPKKYRLLKQAQKARGA
jgi:hypothetical protein